MTFKLPQLHLPKLRTLMASLVFGLISSWASAEIEMLDRVVAIVDQTTVSQSELDARLEEIVARSQAAGVNLPPMAKLREQVLDQLILETLQLNMAQRFGIQTADEQVNEAIRDIMSKQRINEAQLLQGLAAEGLTVNEFKENLRRQLTLQTVSQGVVSSRIQISEKDVDNFLNSADAQFWISPEYHLQHILISVSQNGGTTAAANAQNKATEIYQRLVDGANFAEVAIAESKGPAALKGGDLGWRKSSELPTLFADAVGSLEAGAISKPIRSQAGFHIVKMIEKRGETKQIVTQSKVRHILIETSEILNKEEARKKLDKIRKDIIDGGDFSVAAKRYSDDIGSKMSGGEMGWSNPGTFVPEFEETMNNIEINKVSEPFLTQFGWHILQVLERREEDLAEEVIRSRARNLLIGRRFEDEVQVWLQEMRDDAFIETKI